MNVAKRGSAAPLPLQDALNQQRPLFVRAAWFSFILGLLMLAPSWFMFFTRVRQV